MGGPEVRLRYLPVPLETDYYLTPLTAYLRAHGLPVDAEPLADCIVAAKERGLKPHRFKRSGELPRVRRVLGALAGLTPTNLLDIGTGRGAFLWPLMDRFPDLPVMCVDPLEHRVELLQRVRDGGIDTLTPLVGDVTALPFPDATFDGATILEVLEHLPKPELAVAELLRVTRRFVIASVPSKPDDNPEHLRLYTADTLTELFQSAGRRVAVRCEYLLNHIVAVVML